MKAIEVEVNIESAFPGAYFVVTENEAYFAPAGIKHGWKTSDQPVKILDTSIKQDQSLIVLCFMT